MANLYYVRAAVEAATGVKLTLNQMRDYLIEEGMIDSNDDQYFPFRGYKDFYAYDTYERELAFDLDEGLPEDTI